jgi:choline monooxygenase
VVSSPREAIPVKGGAPIDARIDPDIERARTLPGAFYGDETVWRDQRDRLFPRSFHLYPDGVLPEGTLVPWRFLAGCLDEPLIVSGDRCMTNVCSHRGHLLVTEPRPAARAIRCRYHGRRFDLAGRCLSAPGFESVVGFPSDDDHLREIASGRWGPLLFASLAPSVAIEAFLGPLRERVGWLPLDEAQLDAEGARTHTIDASWMLYCDNYLEGFHVPYVHSGLAKGIALESYETELWPLGSLQLVEAAPGEPALEAPAGHPDAGRRLAAYYAFLFPCTMLNFYPWGLSANVILPQGPRHTVVRYQAFVWDASLRRRGAGGDLDRVEREDQEVVIATQRGVQSRFYDRGRYAPAHERGVHAFHRLLTAR